jgi:hypothetical protein
MDVRREKEESRYVTKVYRKKFFYGKMNFAGDD